MLEKSNLLGNRKNDYFLTWEWKYQLICNSIAQALLKKQSNVKTIIYILIYFSAHGHYCMYFVMILAVKCCQSCVVIIKLASLVLLQNICDEVYFSFSFWVLKLTHYTLTHSGRCGASSLIWLYILFTSISISLTWCVCGVQMCLQWPCCTM